MAANIVQLYGLDWSFVFSCVILLTWITIIGFYIISLFYGRIHLHKPRKIDPESNIDLPGVSILKPLISLGDPNLIENLTSYFHLDYPKYEILFCIQDECHHELIKAINGLAAKYPQVDTQIFLGAQSFGVNPKINNLLNGYEAAKYPLILISDAGIKVKPDTLTDMALHMTEKVGLVHQLPHMLDGDLSFSRVVEKVWFGGAQSRVYVSANACSINCMTGMSCLFRRKVLDEEGGLKALSNYLGEDFFLSQTMINKGLGVVLSSQPAMQNSGMTSLKAFRIRMMRWMYLRMAVMPQLYILEPLTENVLLGPLTALAVQYTFSVPFYIFLPAHMVLMCSLDYILACVIENRRPSYSIFSHVKAWLYRETLFLYVYICMLKMRNVSWGGQKYVVHLGGVTTIVSGDMHSPLLKV